MRRRGAYRVCVTVSPTSVEALQRACDALERSTPLLVQAMRTAPADARPKKMRWTNVEIAAHMYGTVTEAEKSLRGAPSMIDGVDPSAALDEQIVAEVTERDPAVLAELTADRTAAFLTVARTRPADEAAGFRRATVATLVGLLALDHHLHGGQFSETAGAPWTGRLADMYYPLRAVLPYAFDAQAARGFNGSYALRLRGVDPVRYAVVDGELHIDAAGRAECTITADPQTFLRFGIGVVSQLRATLTGKMRAGGPKPWLVFAVNRLFPPIPHGGVAR
jgi:putative sterol carrier protein